MIEVFDLGVLSGQAAVCSYQEILFDKCDLAKTEKISLAKDKRKLSVTKSDGRSNQRMLPLVKALVQIIGR